MANAGYDVVEIRFVIEEHWTITYVALKAIGDCPIGVQGWHAKRFPPTKSVKDIMNAMWGLDGVERDDFVLWPQEAP